MYKKFNKSSQRKRSHFRSGEGPENLEFEDVSPKNSGTFEPKPKEFAPGFEAKTFKDLAFGQVTLHVNPDEEAAYLADPYGIIAKTNQVVDAAYTGTENEDGNIVQQLALGSSSNFKDVPDLVKEDIIINYNYAKHTPSDNADSKVNAKFAYPWAEINSSIQAESFYDLPFFKWYVEDVNNYYSDNMLSLIDEYQVILQYSYQVVLKYKVIRSLEKHLKGMCYQNGSNIMNSIYGRLKKKTFINVIESVSDAIGSHYLDKAWFNQIAMLLAIPCRKSNSMLDPLLELVPKYENNPNIKVWATITDKTGGKNPIIDTSSTTYTGIFSDVDNVMNKMSAYELLKMARLGYNETQLNTWMNSIITSVEDLTNKLASMTSQFLDMDVAFKRMERNGLTNWKLGQFLLLDKLSEDYEPRFNKMVYDIIRASFTGGAKITYDLTLNKWKTVSPWDKFLGVPTYDKITGGSVLTFSTKTVVKPNGTPTSVTYPVLFRVADNKAKILTRRANEYEISLSDEVVTTGAKGRILGRISPISSYDSDEFHVPSADITSIAAKPIDQSWICHMMTNLFGYNKLLVATNTYDYSLSPDMLTSVDITINDLTNAVDTFARQNAPFRVLKTTLEPKLGFKI